MDRSSLQMQPTYIQAHARVWVSGGMVNIFNFEEHKSSHKHYATKGTFPVAYLFLRCTILVDDIHQPPHFRISNKEAVWPLMVTLSRRDN